MIRSMSVEGGRSLAIAELILFDGSSAYIETYLASVCFPLGDGMVYYTSFPIPGENAPSIPAQKIADWYLSRSLEETATTSSSEGERSDDNRGGGCNSGMGFMALVGFMCLSIARKR